MKTTYSGNGKLKLESSVREHISDALLEEIARALKSISGYGSIEIYIQDHNVTQITVRNIKKTRHILAQ